MKSTCDGYYLLVQWTESIFQGKPAFIWTEHSGLNPVSLCDNNHHLISSDLTFLSSRPFIPTTITPHRTDNLALITLSISETQTERICPPVVSVWQVVCRLSVPPAPPPVHGPGAPIRAQRGESDSGALAFQKRAGENEPWRKSEVIIFIISQGSNCGNGDLWGGERERERGRCTSCSSSLLIGPYKLQW